MKMDTNQAKKLLHESKIFLPPDEDDLKENLINLNDVFYWACADCIEVKDEELVEVAELFFYYGWCGILYWVSEKRNKQKSEFKDVNRFIEFVKQEEKIKKEIPNSSKRAYAKIIYKLGK